MFTVRKPTTSLLELFIRDEHQYHDSIQPIPDARHSKSIQEWTIVETLHIANGKLTFLFS